MGRKGTAILWFKRFVILVFSLTLTACGGTGKESGAGGSGEGDSGKEQVFYEIRETAVPDPNQALADLRDEDGRIWEQDYQFKGGKLYRLVEIQVKSENPDKIETQVYMQVLDPAHGAWENHRIPASHWDEAAEYEVYLPQQIITVEEDRVYLKVYYADGTHHLGVWSEDGSGGLLGVLPEELWDMKMKLVVVDGKAVGAYERGRDSILLLDEGAEGLQVKGGVTISGQVLDVLRNPQGGELYWYGYDEERKTGVWRVEGNAPAARNLEGKGNASLAVCSDGGVLYLANSQDLWRCSEKGEPESLCHFFDLDYYIDEMQGMSVQEDAVSLLARFEGKDYILQVTKSEGAVQEKQKVVLAVVRVLPQKSHLRQAVAQFNRRSREYRVEIIEPEEGESGIAFADRIQREMLASGTGPDLFYGIGEAEGFAKNGYLQEVSDFLPEEGVLWQAAVEDGVIQGRQYGIPYECRLRFATYSLELTRGRDSWTLDELMEAVRGSDAEVLQAGWSAMELVWNYGLHDKSSKRFIDWEKGESHLDEAPFLDFLAFIREYADGEDYALVDPFANPDTRLLEGKVAAVAPREDVMNLDSLNELEVRFQGQPAYIGYPRAEGNGIYVRSSHFYVSSLTEQKEGCRAFLDFMLSEEVQNDYVDYKDSLSFDSTELPTRLSAMEYYIEKKKQEKLSEYPTGITPEGISYNKGGLSEEQEEAFRFLLENAHPWNWNDTEISGMVWEELEPYFAGQKTAEEAAKTLDNRVQLYLDERK